MSLEAGQLVDNRYRVGHILGKGGMGSVYRAWDTRLDRPIALKELIPQPDLEPDLLEQLRQQFEHEARVLATLNHANLVRVNDYFFWEENQYLVMDFVEGQSLAERIQEQGPQAESNVIRWATQLLKALAHCHKRGIIHRDIKPQNIIITPDGNAILVDFGLVKLWDPNDPHTRTVMRGAGTPAYAPPEQYDGDWGHTDPRSDIYSLGATLYHAVTGQMPPSATQRMASPDEFAPPRHINTALSAAVEAAILKAMEVPMDRRFQKAEEMAQALGLSTPTKSEMKMPPPQKTAVLPETPSQAPIPDNAALPPKTTALPEVSPAAPNGTRSKKVWLIVAAAIAFCLVSAVGSGIVLRAIRNRNQQTVEPPPTEEIIEPPTEEITEPPTREQAPPPQEVIRVTVGEDLAVAIELAAPGSTLRLEPGTYELERALTIKKPLQLVGAGMAETVVVAKDKGSVLTFHGDGLFSAEELTFRHEGQTPADVVRIEGGEISFVHVWFTGAVSEEGQNPSAGLKITGGTRGKVQDCVAVENDMDGIRLEDDAQVELINNTCNDNVQAGIHYRDNSGGIARQNECARNDRSGITVTGQAQPTLEQNIATDNTTAGIHYVDESSGTARQNKCLKNGLSGIIVTGAAFPTLEENNCDNNTENGIGYFGDAHGVARKNHCAQNGLNGIAVNEQAQPLVENNFCEENEKIGIRYGGSAGGEARGNECTGNLLSGFLVTEAAAPLLEDNLSTLNTESGIAYFQNAGGKARGNRSTGNGLHGISLNGEAQPTLEDNVCAENEQVGIRFSDSATGIAQNNECNNNGLSGIVVRAEAQPTLEENRCMGNQENGIAYFGTAGGVAGGNTCTENILNGISASDQATPLIEGNLCSSNLEAGIAYFGESGGSAVGNACTENQWGIFVKETANPEIGDNDLRDNEINFTDQR